jgi:two-component system chemotaxis response regulator CheY
MDGYEALALIREHDPGAVVYVVTADIQAKARERVLAAGAAGKETKPIEERRLAEIIASLGRE